MKKFVSGLLILGLLCQIVLVLITAHTPPITRDAIIHHLAVPKLYLQQGGIYEIPEIIFSYYPQLIDLLYCIPLWFGNDIIPKYIHFLFALLTSLVIFLFLVKRHGKNWALFAALFFLTIPVITKLSISVYIDLGLILFSTCSLLAIIIWLRKPESLKWLLIAAIASGLAVSTKYTGLITILILSLMIPYFYIKNASDNVKEQLRALSYSFVFILVSLLVFSPWAIKNIIWTGNPIYPLYDSYFSEKPRQTSFSRNKEEITKGIGHFQVRKLLYDEKWYETLTIPVRVFFQGQDNNPKFFDGKLNPFLLLLPLLLLLLKSKERISHENQILLIFSILFILIVFLKTDMRARYIAPVLPPLVILSTKGLYTISEYLRANKKFRHFKYIVPFVLTFSLLSLNVQYFKELIEKIEPLTYITGTLSRDQYLEKHLPDYATIHYSNQFIPEKSHILAVFLRYRSYYFEHKVDFSSHLLKTSIKQARSSSDIYHLLKQKGFTHLIVRLDLFQEWLKFQENSYINHTSQFFEQYTRLLFEQNGYGLYEIRN